MARPNKVHSYQITSVCVCCCTTSLLHPHSYLHKFSATKTLRGSLRGRRHYVDVVDKASWFHCRLLRLLRVALSEVGLSSWSLLNLTSCWAKSAQAKREQGQSTAVNSIAAMAVPASCYMVGCCTVKSIDTVLQSRAYYQ